MSTGHWRTLAVRKSLATPLPPRPGFGVNELFHRCLGEIFLREFAKNPNSNRTLSFERALKSLAAHPRPLRDGLQAIKEVNMIGEKLGLLLQKALEKERQKRPDDPDLNAGASPRRHTPAASPQRGSPGAPRRVSNGTTARSPVSPARIPANSSPSPEASPRSRARVPVVTAGSSAGHVLTKLSERTATSARMAAPPTKKAKAPRAQGKKKAYTPGVYTGGWSLVIALLHTEATAPGGEGLFAAVHTWQPDERTLPNKEELERIASLLCRSSFEMVFTADNPYTAWSNMTALKSKGLVQAFNVKGKGRVFGLTPQGRALGVRLVEEYSTKRVSYEEKVLKDDKYELDLNQVWHLIKQVLSAKHHQDALDVVCSQEQDSLRSSSASVTSAGSDVVDLLSSDEEDCRTHLPSATQSAPVQPESKAHLVDMKKPALRLPEHRLKQWPDVPIPSLLPRSGESFEVILLMDVREMAGAGKKKQMEGLLRSVGVKYEQRNLHLGDMMWIVRRPGTTGEENELALDYVAERKTVPDLVASVTDGRYEEQKYRLRKQNIVRQVIYLLEGNISEAHLRKSGCAMATTTLRKLLHKAQVEDGFSVRRTLTGKATAEYLYSLTQHLRRRCEGSTWMDLKRRFTLMSQVQEATRKSTQLKFCDLFAKQLLKIKCSPVVAKAVVTKFGCPRLLYGAYEASDLPEEKKALMLKNFPLGVNNRKLGVVLSQRLYSMFDDYDEGDYENLSQSMSLSQSYE